MKFGRNWGRLGMKSEWTIKKISEIAEINPRESIKKGIVAKKIPMDVLQPFTRDVPSFQYEVFKGGTKFRNKDTIMARITPCLENGKIAQIGCLDPGEVGFGSTEYIVFRAREGTDPDFLYYLIRSPLVREPSIKSMVGSSGRQRVQTNVVADLQIAVPGIVEQKCIGDLLKVLDDKIQLNTKINKNLSEQLQALYTSEFDVTIHHATAKLSDICHYSVEKVNVDELSTKTYYSTENMQPNKVSSVEATNLPNIKQTTRCHKGDVLVSNIRPYFKKIEYVTTECGCSTDVLCFVPASKELSAFLYETLYADRFFDYMVAGSKGTKMPRGDKQQIMQYEVVMPSSEQLLAFNAAATPMLALITNGLLENERLSMLRDSLLPRLMAGELDVSDIDF